MKRVFEISKEIKISNFWKKLYQECYIMDEIRTRDSLESKRKEVGFVRIRYKVEIPLPPTGHVDLSKLQISEKLNRPCQFRPRVRILTMDNVRQCEAHSRKPCERKGRGGKKRRRKDERSMKMQGWTTQVTPNASLLVKSSIIRVVTID